MFATDNAIYQLIRVSEGRPLRAADHAEIMCASFRALYGADPGIGPEDIVKGAAGLFRTGRPMTDVLIEAWLSPVRMDSGDGKQPQAKLEIGVCGSLLYPGYVLWHSRLRAMLTPYESLFSELPCLTARINASYALGYARANGCDAAIHSSQGNAVGLACGVWVNRTGDGLPPEIASEWPLFCVDGAGVCTPSLESGAMDSVQRRTGIMALALNRKTVTERAIIEDEFSGFDEVFAITPQGALSVHSYGDRLYFNLTASGINAFLSRLT